MIYDIKDKLKELAPKFLLPTITLIVNDAYNSLYVQVNVGERYAGAFDLTPLPGNEEVVVSHDVRLHEDFRGKGLGKQLHNLRIAACKEAGAKTIIATVNRENAIELSILKKFGWIYVTDITPTALLYKRIL